MLSVDAPNKTAITNMFGLRLNAPGAVTLDAPNALTIAFNAACVGPCEAFSSTLSTSAMPIVYCTNVLGAYASMSLESLSSAAVRFAAHGNSAAVAGGSETTLRGSAGLSLSLLAKPAPSGGGAGRSLVIEGTVVIANNSLEYTATASSLASVSTADGIAGAIVSIAPKVNVSVSGGGAALAFVGNVCKCPRGLYHGALTAAAIRCRRLPRVGGGGGAAACEHFRVTANWRRFQSVWGGASDRGKCCDVAGCDSGIMVRIVGSRCVSLCPRLRSVPHISYAFNRTKSAPPRHE